MFPMIISLLCLGLCLGQKMPTPEGTLPRPSMKVVPSSVIPKGTDVTFWCQGPQGSKTVQLWKEEFVFQRNHSKKDVGVKYKIKSFEDGGNYSCRYRQGLHWSEFSAPVLVMVTGFYSKPKLEVHPGSKVDVGATVTLVCQLQFAHDSQGLTFFLLKDGVPAPLQQQSLVGLRNTFTLPSVKAEDAGNYSCIYSVTANKMKASFPSDVLSLEVTGQEIPPPQREVSDYTTGDIICLTLAGLVLLILGVLLVEAWHSGRGS